MVVGHAQEVETGFLQQVSVTRGGTEGVGIRTSALGASATVADDTFKITYGEVCPSQDVFRITEEISAIIGREHDTGVGGTHHDIACHGDVQSLSMDGEKAENGDGQTKQTDSHKALSSEILRAPTYRLA